MTKQNQSEKNQANRPASEFRPGIVQIDGVEMNFPCLLPNPPQTWNGFACPFFTLEEGKRICAAMVARDDTPAEYDGAKDVFVIDGQRDGQPDVYDAVLIDGVKHYAIGAWGWCWSEASVYGQVAALLAAEDIRATEEYPGFVEIELKNGKRADFGDSDGWWAWNYEDGDTDDEAAEGPRSGAELGEIVAYIKRELARIDPVTDDERSNGPAR